jgi:hypothetical protein
LSDPELRDCAHSIEYFGIRDGACPIPYVCCTQIRVVLVGTQGN